MQWSGGKISGAGSRCGGGGGMVLEGSGLPAGLQLYAAAAAQLAPRPTWPPFLPFFGVPPPFLARPRLPHPLPARAPHGPPSEDSNEDGGSSKGRPKFAVHLKKAQFFCSNNF